MKMTDREITFFTKKLQLTHRRDNYINQHLDIMSQDTILAGEIRIRDNEMIHSIMFRHSNNLYYFIDSNYGSNDFSSSHEFFKELHSHVMKYYYSKKNGDLEMKFMMHALNTNSQLYKFDNQQSSPRI